MVTKLTLEDVLDNPESNLPPAYLGSSSYHPTILKELKKLLAIYEPRALSETVFKTSELIVQATTSGEGVLENGLRQIDTMVPFLSDFFSSPTVPYTGSVGSLGNAVVKSLQELSSYYEENNVIEPQITMMTDALVTTDHAKLFGPCPSWLDISISTDSLPPHFSWFNTPVSVVCSSFDEWLLTLNRKRRYKVKELLEMKKGESAKILQFRYDYRTVDWLLTSVFSKLAGDWKCDPDSLTGVRRQWLMAAAIANTKSSGCEALVFEASDGLDYEESSVKGRAVFLIDTTTGRATLQGVCGPLNLGSYFLAQFMRIVHCEQERYVTPALRQVRYLDPCCVNGFQDIGDPYFVYKRVVANADMVKPLYYAGNHHKCFAGCSESPIQPPYVQVNSLSGGKSSAVWTLPEKPAVLFDPC